MDKPIYNGTNYYPITPDGKLKALCSCSGNNVTFKVDIETGKLYQKYLDDKNNGEVFTIADNGHLNVESDNEASSLLNWQFRPFTYTFQHIETRIDPLYFTSKRFTYVSRLINHEMC